MARKRRSTRPPGSAPGTIEAPSGAEATRVHALAYGPKDLWEGEVEDLLAIAELRRRWPVLWLDVHGLRDTRVLAELGREFGLHRLALEDVANTGQRAKLEAYDHGAFIVVRLLRWSAQSTKPATRALDSEPDDQELALFLGPGWVLTFREGSQDPFEIVRKRIREGRATIRGAGADYLTYALLDATVDALAPVLQNLAEHLDALGRKVATGPTPAVLAEIHRTKRYIGGLRRAIWPQRDVTQGLLVGAIPSVTDDTRLHLRDVHDHMQRAIDELESCRDEVIGLGEAHHVALSHRTNEVMALLTLVGTVFMPLSFLASLYGMNFDREASPYNMPELGARFGYPVVIGIMLLVASSMLVGFWREGWFQLVGLRKRRDEDPEGGRASPPKTPTSTG